MPFRKPIYLINVLCFSLFIFIALLVIVFLSFFLSFFFFFFLSSFYTCLFLFYSFFVFLPLFLSFSLFSFFLSFCHFLFKILNLFDSGDKKYKTEPSEGKLIIKDLTLEDEGKYLCEFHDVNDGTPLELEITYNATSEYL